MRAILVCGREAGRGLPPRRGVLGDPSSPRVTLVLSRLRCIESLGQKGADGERWESLRLKTRNWKAEVSITFILHLRMEL